MNFGNNDIYRLYILVVRRYRLYILVVRRYHLYILVVRRYHLYILVVRRYRLYILVVPAVIITFCYANVVLVVWRQSREEIQTTARNGETALRRTVRNARHISRAKIKTIKVSTLTSYPFSFIISRHYCSD